MNDKDIGFGSKAVGPGQRMMFPDGSFNVKRVNTIFDLYHHLVLCRWELFMTYVTIFYIVSNALFAILYNCIGIHHLSGIEDLGILENLTATFFFSIQTFTTVGYGHIHPVGFWANSLSSFVALTGVLSVSVISGILFGRFTRRSDHIVFSKNSVITDFNDKKAFMFRIANIKKTELIALKAKVVFSRFEMIHGERKRGYHNINLERDTLMLFPLNWTIVHTIDEKSPLYGITEEEMLHTNAEFIVLIAGHDDTSKETVYARYSYIAEDLVWDKKFIPAFTMTDKGNVVFDINDIDKLV
jgi:inward rectifier potassium channel